MKSHTVPRKLLEQFAYSDPVTKPLPSWRYEKGRRPYWKASPESATGIECHFADPSDAAKGAGVETRLAHEYEEPVNQFLYRLDDPSFTPSDLKCRHLAFYITLLFNRSEARRSAAVHLQRVTRHAYEKFLSNDTQVATVAAKWNIDLLPGGLAQGVIDHQKT